MKKNIYFLLFPTIFFFIASATFAQSVLIEPSNSSKQFVTKTTSSVYGHFSTTANMGADLLFKRAATGDGSTGTNVGVISTFTDRLYIGGRLSNGLSLGADDVERMRISVTGLVGIGTVNPNYNLHIHNPITGTSAVLQLTNESIGSAITDGLYIGENDFGNASIYNKESGSLRLGTNNSAFLALNNEKACLSCLSPAGKFDIWHNTANTPTNPHLTLRTTNNASNGIIRMENSSGSNYFGQYFNLNSTTAANNFLSFDYNGSTPILDMQGNGNVKVSGFTTLGDDAAAPKIKMKEITINTSSSNTGTSVGVAHGVTASKIISINVIVPAGSLFIPPAYDSDSNLRYNYYFDSGYVYIQNQAASCTSGIHICSKVANVVITYKQ